MGSLAVTNASVPVAIAADAAGSSLVASTMCKGLGWTLKQGAVCVRDPHEQRIHGHSQSGHCRLKMGTVVLAQLASGPDSLSKDRRREELDLL